MLDGLAFLLFLIIKMELESINYELIWGIGFPQGLENKTDIFTLITHVFLIKNGFSCVQPEVEVLILKISLFLEKCL